MGVLWKNGDLSRKMMMSLAVTTMAMSMMIRCVSGELHRVGGKKGWWKQNDVNYTVWARNEHFYLNDWLKFYLNKDMYNVLEVNKTSYESCNDKDPITNITRSRQGWTNVFHLNESRHYYFLSGRGFCWSGMKFGLFVHHHPPPPVSAPVINGSPSSTHGSHMMIDVLVAAFIIYFGLMSYF